MYRIRKIKFRNHPILSNLEIDFCNSNGESIDTIIIAGENGCGKSTILNELYNIASQKADTEYSVEIEDDKGIANLMFYYRDSRDGNSKYLFLKDDRGHDVQYALPSSKRLYPFKGIFSDVDINFKADPIDSVTSLDIDKNGASRRSNMDISTEINQLLIDIQDLDAASAVEEIKANPEKQAKDITIDQRISRFSNAFRFMFDGLAYDRVDNSNNKKRVLFSSYQKDIPIENLSSGEKQIVYRGCFMLKDINAINGAFVFIDEPEISLHPLWQSKILEFYRKMFVNDKGFQTSQIFTVTHSPFVVQSALKNNAKVIVLQKNTEGIIAVSDKPEYYKCGSVEAIEDAFAIDDFSIDEPTVYLEGRTDEMYFNRALEVYKLTVPFSFKWIGYIDEKGQEVNTGKDALNKAVLFLSSHCLNTKCICLYDCDANKETKISNNLAALSMPYYENSKGITVGIENALEFGDIDIEMFNIPKKTRDGYGFEKIIPEFQKMACCKYICELDDNILESVFVHLKDTICVLEGIYTNNQQ